MKLDQVVCQLKGDEGITYLEDDFQLEMNEEVYHQWVIQLSRVTTDNEALTCANRTSDRWPHIVCHIDYDNNCSKIIRQKGKKKDKQNKP